MGEANLPAQEPQADADARISRPDEYPGWSGGYQESPAEGSSQAHGLIWTVRGRAGFARFATVRRERRGPLSLAVVPRGEGDHDPPRVAYVVGKRVGGAVVRNRVRRRLRACVRVHRQALQPGASYLIGASPAAAEASFSDLDSALDQLLKVSAR